MEPLLTMRQFCTILGIQSQTGYKWRREGKIKALKVGHSLRIEKSELYRLLDTTPSFRDQAVHEARDFMAAHPDYLPTPANEKRILDFIDRNNLPITSESMKIAFEILMALGALESRPEPTPTQEEINA